MNSRRGNRRQAVLPSLSFPAVLLLLGLLGLLPACRPPAESEAGAHLLLTTAELAPDSTFELRFEEPLIPVELINTPADPSPLVVSPPLRGRFIWRSRRSGLFTPDEPLRLHTTYEFRLRPGLRNAQGQPVPAHLRRRFQTPPLGGHLINRDFPQTNNAPVLPEFLLTLNAPVELQQVRRLAAFVAGRQRVGALVEPLRTNTDAANPHRYLSQAMPPTWAAGFHRARPDAPALPTTPGRPDLHHAFLLRPAEPLPAGGPWLLRLAPGLRSPEVPEGGTAEIVAPVGLVLPFEIREVETQSDLVSGRSLVVHFSRPLRSTNVLDFIRVEPAVDGLSVTPFQGRSSLRLHGPFLTRRDYRLTFLAGLPAEEPVQLAHDDGYTVSWDPVPSHVRLPFFDTPQLAGGRRDFELVAVNTPEVRLRVKALNEHTLIHTRRAYQQYLRPNPPWDPKDRPGAPLDYAGVPGKTLLATNFPTRAPEDEVRRLSLSWDQLLPPGTRGALFVDVEMEGASPARGESRPRSGPQGIVQLTDLGWVAKRGDQAIELWVFSHRTGQGVPDARVSMRSEENEVRSTGITDREGRVRLPDGEGDAWVLVEKEGDLHAAPLFEGELGTWRFQLPDGWSAAQSTRIEGFTDREAYRPGEKLHLQAYVREWGTNGWKIPNPDQVQGVEVRLVNPRQETILQTNAPIRATGSLTCSLDLPQGIRGSYRVELRPVRPPGVKLSEPGNLEGRGDGEPAVLEFEVRDFQPPAFEVLLPAVGELAPDAGLEIPVRARHLFGEPLRRAHLKWTFMARPQGFRPRGWSAYQFGQEPDDDDSDASASAESLAQSGEADLTADAPPVLRPRLNSPPSQPGPRLGQLRVEVTDLNQQTVAEVAEMVRHSSDFYLGFRWAGGPEAVFATNQPLPFEVVAVNPRGEPVAQPVEVTARLLRREWRTVRAEEASGALNYRSEAVDQELARFPVRTLGASRHGETWQTDPGAAPLPEIPGLERPGSYLAEFSARDAAGRPVLTRVPFQVAGDARIAWNFRNGALLELVPDRSEYAPGDTATLLVKAPFSGTAWVTVEREGVRRSFTTSLSGNAPAIQVPLLPGDSPNVFVGVQLVRGHADSPRQFPMPEWRVGYVSLPVRDPADRLGVSVSSSREESPPGAELTATARVTGPDGGAVVGAEVILYAVDEGYLLLQGTAVPDLHAALHQPRSLGVRTHLSLPELFPENPALRVFGNKGHPGGGGGGLNETRRNFIPCPLWQSGLLTDAQGEVQVKFRAPDGLTRYRLVAVATQGASRAGHDAVTFAVRKPLMIEPALPRFAHVGDRLQARAVVFNQTKSARRVRATLSLPEHVVPSAGAEAGLAHSLDLAAGATAVVEFPVEMRQPGQAAWVWRVATADAGEALQDATESTPVVTPAEPEVHDARSLRLGAGTTNLLATLDPRFEEAAGTLTVRVGSSPLAVLREGLRYLLHYPYGCVEQTSSSLLPWLALRDFPELLATQATSPSTEVIGAGVERLFRMQTRDGGLSYWPGGSQPDRWGSAYGALVLALARESGVALPTNRLDRLHRWLLEQAVTDPPEPDDPALEARVVTATAFALARLPQPGLNQALQRSHDRLSPDQRALLALALARSGEPGAAVRAVLASPGTVPPSSPLGRFGHPARTEALELLALLHAEPDPVDTDRRLDRLLGLQSHGHWDTTQGNAWTVWALAEAARKSSGSPASRARLRMGDTVHELSPGSATSLAVVEVPFAAGTLRQGALLTLEGPGRAFVEVGLAARWSNPMKDADPVEHGFALRRTYARLDDANRPDPAAPWTVGDRVLVTLELDAPEDAQWVAIEDPLPAVLEAIEGVFRTDATLPPGLAETWHHDFREVRLDRVLYFRNFLPEGRQVIRYLTRVRAAGDAVAAPARVEAMYEPRRHGLSGSQRVQAASRP